MKKKEEQENEKEDLIIIKDSILNEFSFLKMNS